MKKTLLIIVITLLMLFVIFSSFYVIDHKRMDNNEPIVFSTRGKQYVPPVEITPQTAVENVKRKLDIKSIESITNFDNPKIEEVVFDTQPSMYYFDDKIDVVGKDLYKITFNTTQDGLLGPMVFYVDKLNGALIGTEFRY